MCARSASAKVVIRAGSATARGAFKLGNWRANRHSFAASQVFCRLPAQHRPHGHDDAAFDDILQFPDVTWPVIVLQSSHYIIRNSVDHFALLSSELFDKMFRQ